MKRGQAALEFLTTYGWAFLVILVMIGGMSYFGVLDNVRLAPESCVVSPGFTCHESIILNGDSTGNIKANIVNGAGESIEINANDIEFENVAGSANCKEGVGFFVNGETGNVTVKSGGQIAISGFCDGEVLQGEFIVADISVPYKPVGNTLEKKFTVSVSNAITKGDLALSTDDIQLIALSDADYSGSVTVSEDSEGIIRVRFPDDPQANRDIYYNSTAAWSGEFVVYRGAPSILMPMGGGIDNRGELMRFEYSAGGEIAYVIEKYVPDPFGVFETTAVSDIIYVGPNSAGTIRVFLQDGSYRDITFDYDEASGDGLTVNRLLDWEGTINPPCGYDQIQTYYYDGITELGYGGDQIFYSTERFECDPINME